MVAVAPEKIAALRDALGDDADAVAFADMAELGRNPARIIPAWRDVPRASRRRAPVARDRRADLARAQRRRAGRVPAPRGAAQRGLRRRAGCRAAVPVRHRRARRRRWSREAGRSHPHLVDDGSSEPSDDYRGRDALPRRRRRRCPSRRPSTRRAAVRPRDARRSCARSSPRRAARGRPRRGARRATWCSPSTRSRPTACATAGGSGVLRTWRDDGDARLRGPRPRAASTTRSPAAAGPATGQPAAAASGWPTSSATSSSSARCPPAPSCGCAWPPPDRAAAGLRGPQRASRTSARPWARAARAKRASASAAARRRLQRLRERQVGRLGGGGCA